MPADSDSTKPPSEGEPSLELDYPCTWRYRVIVEDAASLRDEAMSYFADGEYALTDGRASSGGRYVAMELEIEVRDEGHRHEVLRWLQGLEVVRFVL